MKIYFNKLLLPLNMLMVVFASVQCTSSKNTNQGNTHSFHAFSGVEDVYCQRWTSGIQGGGSGIDIFISVTSELPQGLLIDSVYFRGQVTKLKPEPNNSLVYVGHFKTEINQPQDIIMSSDPKDEYGNSLPIVKAKIPFEMANTECIISYKYLRKTQYYKLDVVEKEPISHPSAPPNKQ